LKALRARDDDNEYFLYSSKSVDFSQDERFKIRIGTGSRARKGNIWVQTGMIDQALSDRIQVFFGPLQVLPLGMPRRVASVLAVHDLVHIIFPASMTLVNYLVLKFFLPRSVAKADSIITGSHTTAGLIRERLGARAVGVNVIYHGLPPHIRPRSRDDAREFLEQAYNVSDPYVLCVGTVEPRKNLITLLRAFRRLQDRYYKKKTKLIIAGGLGWKTGPILSEIEKLRLKDSVRLTKQISDEELGKLYSGAELLVFPSLYEGFGFPPLEAMAAGIPVLCSSSSSLPEIVGDAALITPPRHVGWMAWQMARLLDNPALREDLIEKGFNHVRRFSWESSAEKTLEVFRETLRKKAVEGKTRRKRS
jgi:glycosyltransferase involved in cell wall biosynthesis